MANTVTIDVVGRFIDNVTDPANQAEEAISDVTDEVRNLNRQRANPHINADASGARREISNTQRLLYRLNNSRVKTIIDAVDNASRVIDSVTDTAKKLTKNAWTAVIKVKDVATAPLKAIKNSIFSIKGAITALVGAAAFNQFVNAPISTADQYSSAKIGFSTLLGSEKGQTMMDDLDEFARITPFNTSQVIANAQKMLAMGWDAESIITDMKTIGDAAAATGKGDEGLSRIVLALSQIRSKGKLSTEELNQLAEAGISAKRYIAEGLGFGTGDEGLMAMTKALEGGKIGAEAGINAIIEGMKEYDGMMEKTANETVEGLKAQLEDTFEINIIRRWGQGLQDGAKKGMGSILQLLDEAEGALKSVGDMLYNLGKTISNYFAGVLANTVTRVKEITASAEFKNADLAGKINMLWEGAIKNPFKDWWADKVQPWWDGKFMPWLAEKAGNIGKKIGTGLTTGLLALFGVDVSGIVGDGVDVGASFFRGFAEGFDFGAITDGLVTAIANVFSKLPTWAQLLLTGAGISKGAKIVNTVAGGIDKAISFVGSAGNSMVAGTGLLGNLATRGYAAAGGAAANTGMTGMQAVIAGAKSLLPTIAKAAGWITAGVSAISGGVDLYTGIKSNNITDEQKQANKASGVLKMSAPAIGAAIGSFIAPGLGTAIGAGIGGLLGMAGGGAIKKNAYKNATNAELAKQESDKKTMEELERRQKLINDKIAESFGNVKLTADEISKIIDSFVIGDKAEAMDKFANATDDAKSAWTTLTAAAGKMNRWNWKASLKFKFDDTDKQEYLAAVQEYITDAEEVVDAQHYKFTTAVEMLIDPDDETGDTIIKQNDAYFEKVQKELDGYTTELNNKVKLALDDGVIDESEAQVIAKLQQKIADITNKVANAQSEAELEAIKIKFSSGNIDYESYQALQEEIKTKLESSIAQYDEALTASITSLKLQLDEGAINQATYDSQVQALADGYTANVNSLKAKAAELQLEIVGDAFKFDKETLNKALSNSLAYNIDPVNWTEDQAKQYLGVDNLGESARLTIGAMLSNVAATLPAESTAAARDGIVNSLNMTDENVEKMSGTFKTGIQKALDTAAANQFGVSATVNITPSYKVNGAAIPQKANGGLVNGAQMVIAGEAGPEMIVPLSGQRRSRGLDLWSKAGAMLGVPGFANGGMVGQDEGLRFAATAGTETATAGQNVQVEVGGITFEINMPEGTTDVSAEIKAQAEEIAETVAGVLYRSFSAQFENTPLRG